VKAGTPKLYQARQFAEIAGVTVRALHHYDRLGLLKPQHRSASGYRLYGESDLARQEQIAVLKFLGLPLKQIREVLRDRATLPEVLKRQQRVLVEKRTQIDRAIRAIEEAERSLEANRKPKWEFFKQILKEIKMQNDTDWMKKYYSKEALAKLEERKALWSPQLQEQVSKDWAALFKDIEASLDEDPSSAKAQALASRWKKLINAFTGGDPEILTGLKAKSADQENWPANAQQYRIRPEIQTFILKALKISGGR
jgi:MerR family transcriptional regulator, thiopeptide resistance regulator